MARKKTSQGRKAKKKRPNTASTNTATHTPSPHSPTHPSNKRSGGACCTSNGGPVPNLFWGAISMNQVRTLPRFVGLPPPESIMPLPSPDAASFLRQDSPPWRSLHTGLLTTGLLREALGLKEPTAARVVGGRHESSHAPMLAAFHHLRQAHQLPSDSGPEETAAWRTRVVEEMGKQQHQGGAQGGQLGGGQQQHQQQQRQQERVAGATPLKERQADSGRQQQQPEQQHEGADWPSNHEARYRHCAAALSSGGLVRVRCGWGKTQEGAALEQLMRLLPACRLHEVGMCTLPAPAPSRWPHLPPLAASPDALITHTLPLDPTTAHRLARCMREIHHYHHRQQQQQREQSDGQGRESEAQTPAAEAEVEAVRQQAQRLQLILRWLLEAVPISSEGGSEGQEEGEAEEKSDEEGEVSCGGGDDDSSGSGCGEADDEGDEYDHGNEHGDHDDDDDEEDSGCRSVDGALVGAAAEGNVAQGGGVGGSGTAHSKGGDGARDDPPPCQQRHAAQPSSTGTSPSPSSYISTPPLPSPPLPSYSAELRTAVLSSRLPVLLLCGRCAAGGQRQGHHQGGGGQGQVEHGQLVLPSPQLPPHLTAATSTAATPPSPPLPAWPRASSPLCTVVPSVGSGAYGCGSNGPSCEGEVRPEGSSELRCGQLGTRCMGAVGALHGGRGEGVAAGGDIEGGSSFTQHQQQQQQQQQQHIHSPPPPPPPPSRKQSVTCCCVCEKELLEEVVAAGGGGDYQTQERGMGKGGREAGGEQGGGRSEGDCGGNSARPCQYDQVYAVVREVVEIKNTCPFGIRQVRRGGKGRLLSEVVLCDPGPRSALVPLWVPQMQLHMAAAGCISGLLVSRSATKGLTLFRMYRDDTYLQRMNTVLDRFCGDFVRPGLAPPPDPFRRLPDYPAFLAATTRLARGAVSLLPGGPWRPHEVAAQGGQGGGLDRDEAFVRRREGGDDDSGEGE